MGVPRVEAQTIDIPGVGAVAGAVVNVGNPHFVLFVEREDFGAHGLAWQELGAKISASPLFAQGTNVEFVRVRAAGEIAFRIFERGCGPTMSSGTGTCASSAAAMFLRGTARELTAIAEGGSQRTVSRERRGDAADRAGGDCLPGRGVSGGTACGGGNLSAAARARVKPAALRAGSTLAVVSPASATKPELVQAGLDALHELGYRTKLMPHALDCGPLYYAGTVEQRVGDLHAAFADAAIDGIVCTRGGGARRNCCRIWMRSWSREPEGLCGIQRPHRAACVAGARGGAGDVPWADGGGRLCAGAGIRPRKLDSRDERRLGLVAGGFGRVLRAGTAEGTLAGGCISILAESMGTPYAMLPASAQEPRILFLEDIGTKPYQWDRMLRHLRYAGLLEHVSGIVFGEMRQCVAAEELPLLEAAVFMRSRISRGRLRLGCALVMWMGRM